MLKANLNLFDSRPIDVVILWVDPSDKHWQEQREFYWRSVKIDCPYSNDVCRFADCQELLFCLRSLYYNASWLRNIYLVTDDHLPSWLDLSHPKIHHIRHRDIIDKNNYPSFNSCAIEMHLNRIPNLSNPFLYLNDDCFITRRTTKRHFFNNRNQAFYFSHRLMTNKTGKKWTNSFNYTITVNENCLNRMFGTRLRQRPDHQGYLIYHEAYDYLAKNAPRYLEETRGLRFRSDASSGKLQVNAYLLAAIGLELGLYQLRLNASQTYYNMHELRARIKFDAEIKELVTNPPMLLCLNNGATIDDKRLVEGIMRSFFPDPAPWETKEPELSTKLYQPLMTKTKTILYKRPINILQDLEKHLAPKRHLTMLSTKNKLNITNNVTRVSAGNTAPLSKPTTLTPDPIIIVDSTAANTRIPSPLIFANANTSEITTLEIDATGGLDAIANDDLQ